MEDVLLGLEDPPSAPVTRTLLRALRAAPPFREGLFGTVVLALCSSAALLIGPLVVQRIIDVHLRVAGSLEVAAVVRLGVIAVVVGLAGAVASRAAVRRMLIATAEGTAHLRVASLDRLHQLALLHVEAERRGGLVQRVTGDIDVLTDFIGWGGVGFLVGLVRVIAALAALTVLAPTVALWVTPLLVVYAVVLHVSQGVVERAHDRVRVHAGASSSAVSETISGLRTLRTYGAEAHALQQVDETVQQQFRAEFRAGAIGAVVFSSADVFAAMLTVVAIAAAVLAGSASVGDAVAALVLLTLLLDPIQTMVEVLPEAQSAMAGLRRVLLLLDTDPAVDRQTATHGLPEGPLDVRMEGLAYTYPNGASVLRAVTAHVPARAHVAVVGETGSGKTTLVKVLARLLHGATGRIEVGGVPLDRIKEDVLRHRVAFVPQECFLFDASLRENLAPAGEATPDDTLTATLADLGILDWALGLPDGLDTQLGERGGRLSAGERQLVALARAALLAPDLLLLDEATSAVDPELEVRLRHAVERLGADRTVVTVAHRLSTAEAADLVLVFDGGELVQQGDHASLLLEAGPYARLHADWTVGTATDAGAHAPVRLGGSSPDL